MCTGSTGGSPGIAQKCQARKHKYQHWQIGVNSFRVLQRGLQTARLTPRKDHKSITWKCQAFVSQNRLLSSCSTKCGIFKFFICFVSYSIMGRVWAVHSEQLSKGEGLFPCCLTAKGVQVQLSSCGRGRQPRGSSRTFWCGVRMLSPLCLLQCCVPRDWESHCRAVASEAPNLHTPL